MEYIWKKAQLRLLVQIYSWIKLKTIKIGPNGLLLNIGGGDFGGETIKWLQSTFVGLV